MAHRECTWVMWAEFRLLLDDIHLLLFALGCCLGLKESRELRKGWALSPLGLWERNLPKETYLHEGAPAEAGNTSLIAKFIWIPCGGFLSFLLLYFIILILYFFFKAVKLSCCSVQKVNSIYILCGLCVFKVTESLLGGRLWILLGEHLKPEEFDQDELGGSRGSKSRCDSASAIESDRPGCKSQLCCWSTMWFGASDFTSLNLGFHFCEMGIIKPQREIWALNVFASLASFHHSSTSTFSHLQGNYLFHYTHGLLVKWLACPSPKR